MADESVRDIPEEIAIRLLNPLNEEDRAELLTAVQDVVADWTPDVAAVANWEEQS